MNEQLLELVANDEFNLLARASLRVAELHGPRHARLAELERLAALERPAELARLTSPPSGAPGS